MNKELRDKVSESIAKQEGQNYPCSNQVVCCGFFSDHTVWKEFCEDNDIKYTINQNSIVLQNDERWEWFRTSYNRRGYRFYKIKVCSEIDEKMFFENIYPYCSLYCKEIEWI